MKRLAVACAVILCVLYSASVAVAIVPGIQYPPAPPPPVSEQNPTPVDNYAYDQHCIGDALYEADDTAVQLTDKVVIADQNDTGGAFFYIEETDKSAGIRVSSPVTVHRGNKVAVAGVLKTLESNKERYIEATQVTADSSSIVIQPLVMDSIYVGGSDLGTHTPGITPYNASPIGLQFGIGPYNKGLLIRTWGLVSSVQAEAHWFRLHVEGVDTGTKVLVPPSVSLPQNGKCVVITAVSSSSYSSSINLISPVLMVRDGSDIAVMDAPAETVDVGPDGQVIGDGSDLSKTHWNLVSLPAVPQWGASGDYASVSSVFQATVPSICSCQVYGDELWRWNPALQSQEGYCFPDINWPERFGPISSAQMGYWIKSCRSGSISYGGVTDLLSTSDRYIALPGSIGEGSSRVFLIGYPFRKAQPFAYTRITDGYRTLSIEQAIQDNWIEPVCHYWHNNSYAYKTLGCSPSAADSTDWEPWRGYWIRSFKSRLALIIPNMTRSLVFQGSELPDSPRIDVDPVTESQPISVVLTFDGAHPSGQTVTFSTTKGSFEGGTNTAMTDTNGRATVTLVRPDSCELETAEVTATVEVDGVTVPAAEPLTVTFDTWSLRFVSSPYTVAVDSSTHTGSVMVTAKLVHSGCGKLGVDQPVSISTTSGSVQLSQTATNTDGEISATLTVGDTAEPTATLTATATGPRTCAVKAHGLVDVNRDADDWPMFMHDPHHSGRSLVNDTDTSKTLYLRWVSEVPTGAMEFGRYSGGGVDSWTIPDHFGSGNPVSHPIYDSSPVHYGWGQQDPDGNGNGDGTVLVGTFVAEYQDCDYQGRRVAYPSSSKGRLLAFDPQRQPVSMGGYIPPKWKFPATTRSEDEYTDDVMDYVGGIACTPAVTKLSNGDTVIVFGSMGRLLSDGTHEGGRVYGLNANGTKRWVYPADENGHDYPASGNRIGSIMSSSPVISDGVAYIGTETGMLLALDAATGTKEFDLQFTDRLPAPPADPAPLRNRMGMSSPAVVNLEGQDYVFIGCENGYVYKVSGAHSPLPGQLTATFIPKVRQLVGSEYETVNNPKSFAGSPSYRGNIYIAEAQYAEVWGNFAFCLDPGDLSELWRWAGDGYPISNEVYPTPALSRNGVYLGDTQGFGFFRLALDKQPDEVPQCLNRFQIEHQLFDSYGSPALTSELALIGDQDGVLHATSQTGYSDALQLKRRNFGSVGDEYIEWPVDGLGGAISSSPALSYAVDGSNQLWVFVTARVRHGDRAGRIYCFGPQPSGNIDDLRMALTRSGSTLNPCGGDITLTATLTGSNVGNKPVTFRTDHGTFVQQYGDTPQHSITVNANTSGVATVHLYGALEDTGNTVVRASCYPDDPYSWVTSESLISGEPGEIITSVIAPSSFSATLTADPDSISPNGSATITAQLRVTTCNAGYRGAHVEFTTNKGTFEEPTDGSGSVHTTTDSDGKAVVHLRASSYEGIADVCALFTTNQGSPPKQCVDVTILRDKLTLSASPSSVSPPAQSTVVTAKLVGPSGPLEGAELVFTTSAGQLTAESWTTNSNGEVQATLSGVSPGNYAVVQVTAPDQSEPGKTIVRRMQVDFLKSARDGDDWPMFMHDPRHTGRTWVDDQAGARTLYLRWVADIPTADTSMGRYLTLSDTHIPGHPFAFDDGGHVVTHPMFDSSPVYYGWGSPENGTVFVGTYVPDYHGTVSPADLRPVAYPKSSKGRLLAFNPLAGTTEPGEAMEPVWKFPATTRSESQYTDDVVDYVGGIACTPAVTKLSTGETIVVFGCEGDGTGTGSGRIYAVCADGQNRGQQKWAYPAQSTDLPIGKIMCSSPTVSGNTVYIGTESRELVALDVSSGTRLFTTILRTSSDELQTDLVGTSSPMVVNLGGQDYVFIGCDDGRVYKVHGTSGAIVGVYPDGGTLGVCVDASPSYRANVFAASTRNQDVMGGGDVLCIDPTEEAVQGGGIGALRTVWKSCALAEVRTTPALSANGAYVGDETGHWFYRFLLDPAVYPATQSTYEDVSLHVFSSSALTSKLAFFGNDLGTLFAFDQLQMQDRLYLKQYTGSSWVDIPNNDIGGPISSSPALAYAVDGSESPWLFVTARNSVSTNGLGKLYCFGPPTIEDPPVPPDPSTIPADEIHGGSIGTLKYLADGSSVEINGKAISGVVQEGAPVAFYVEETDRSSGIRVVPPTNWTAEQWSGISAGKVVNIAGTLGTDHGERVVVPTSVAVCSEPVSAPVDPLLFSLADIGGGPMGLQPGVTLRIPTDDQAALDASGVNNVGLLVRVYGKVTGQISNGFFDGTGFYVDDGSDVYVNPNEADLADHNNGSDLWDGTWHTCSGTMHRNLGVMVKSIADSSGQPVTPVSEGEFISVTGILSTRVDDQGRVLPVIIPRDSSDLASPPDHVFLSKTLLPWPGQDSDAVWNAFSLPLPVALDVTDPQNAYPPKAGIFMDNGGLFAGSPFTELGVQLVAADTLGIQANNVRPGVGYYLCTTGTTGVHYQAVDDTFTDRWVSLPYLGSNFVGSPVKADTPWNRISVTDGSKTVPLPYGFGSLNWAQPGGYWFSATDQAWQSVDYRLPGNMKEWYSFSMWPYRLVSLIVPASVPSTTGSILATVTGTGNSPIAGARVYYKYDSAVTGTNGRTPLADVPVGTVLLTASAPGYVTQSKAVAVAADTESAVSFALAARASAPINMWITASPERIRPDGVEKSTITAHVVDAEGVPVSGKLVAFTRDVGTLSATSAATDETGTCSVMLTSTTDPDTATVTATCDSMAAHVYVEFANDDYPSVRILSPAGGTSISGVGAIVVRAFSYDLGTPVSMKTGFQVYIDGELQADAPRSDAAVSGGRLDTRGLTNGVHVLRASVTDYRGRIMWSQRVYVSIYNMVSEVQLSDDSIFLDDELPSTVHVSGTMNEQGTWSVNIVDTDGNTVFAESGIGPGPVSTTWDGKISGSYEPGVYMLRLSSTSDGMATASTDDNEDTSDLPVIVSWRHGRALITLAISDWVPSWNPGYIGDYMNARKARVLRRSSLASGKAVSVAFRSRDIPFTIVADPYWFGAANKSVANLLKQPYNYWFHTGEGTWEREPGGWERGLGTPLDYRSYLNFHGQFICGTNEWIPNPADRFHQPAFSDLGLSGSTQYCFIHINTCYSAGGPIWHGIAHRHDASIAAAFNIRGEDSTEYTPDRCYIGWDDEYRPQDALWFGYDGLDWTTGLWGYLGQGHTISSAVMQIYLHPFLTGYEGSQGEFLVTYGDPYDTWLY